MTLRWHPKSIVLVLLLLVSGCAAGDPGSAVARSAPQSFSPLVKQVLPSVVNIAVTETISGGEVLNELPPELRDTPLGREFRRRFGNRKEQTMGAGSGFIIDPSRLIVTNNHVVGNADKIVVALSDGTELPAQVIGTDELTDVALIKVDAPHPLPAVHLGRQPRGRGGRLGSRAPATRSASAARSPPASSRRAGATSAPGRSTTSCRSTRRSIPAIPAGRCSTSKARWSAVNTAIYRRPAAPSASASPSRARSSQPIVAELRARGASIAAGSACTVQDAPDDGVTWPACDRRVDAPARRARRPAAGDVVLAVNGEPSDSSRAA